MQGWGEITNFQSSHTVHRAGRNLLRFECDLRLSVGGAELPEGDGVEGEPVPRLRGDLPP